MKRRIFLDTNIVIDYLSKRVPFAEEAMNLFSLSPNYTAVAGQSDYIVTRNPKDFTKSFIPIYTPLNSYRYLIGQAWMTATH